MPETPSISILCYHHFDNPKITPFTVSTQRFKQQMHYLHAQHIAVISLPVLMDHLRNGTPVPDPSVVITIDDGHQSALTQAGPVLRDMGFPFTVFIYPQRIGHKGALTWEEVQHMSREGVDVEGHSYTHPLLNRPPHPMTQTEYLAWLDHELGDSKRVIEAHTGKRVRFLAYPFGGYDERIVERTRKTGYQAALTCDDGNVDRLTDPFHLNRRMVYHHVKIREFTDYFGERPLHLRDRFPRDGQHVGSDVSRITARVENLDQILPETGRIMVDKLGGKARPIAIDPHTGLLRLPLRKPVKPGYYFISLFARDRQNPLLHREASWIFIVRKSK